MPERGGLSNARGGGKNLQMTRCSPRGNRKGFRDAERGPFWGGRGLGSVASPPPIDLCVGGGCGTIDGTDSLHQIAGPSRMARAGSGDFSGHGQYLTRERISVLSRVTVSENRQYLLGRDSRYTSSGTRTPYDKRNHTRNGGDGKKRSLFFTVNRSGCIKTDTTDNQSEPFGT